MSSKAFTKFSCLVSALFLALAICNTSPGQFIVAHRGASFEAPENTLAAFRLAWEQEADAIEGDFYLTADKHIVCIHDKTTKRVAPDVPPLDVAKSTLKELRKLDVGRWKNKRFAGEKVPKLEEVLATVPDGKKFFVEIKCGPEILPVLKKELENSKLQDEQICIISFNQEVVKKCRQEMPHYKCNWLSSFKKNKRNDSWSPSTTSVAEVLRKTKANGIGTQANIQAVDADFLKQMRSTGCECHVWTVNDPEVARHFSNLGVESITTDRPRFIRKAIGAQKK